VTAGEIPPGVLDLDCSAEIERISHWLTGQVGQALRRRGVVVGLSGGVDSAVCMALAARAVGPARVLALLMPERESPPDGLALGRTLAASVGVEAVEEDLTETLEALGCYRRRDAAIGRVVPELGAGWKSKLVIARAEGADLSFFRIVAESPAGQRIERRLPAAEYLEIVAATSFKQRARKAMEYFHADRLHYAVLGTANRLEYDQGFFVKNGDGSADLKPLAHLYKSQVYALARHLGLPEEICTAAPSTDTYSLKQGQDEFFFRLAYVDMDIALWARDHGVPASALAARLGIDEETAAGIYRDIDAKRRAGRYLHAAAAVIGDRAESSMGQSA
jgi:NAD+ synthase